MGLASYISIPDDADLKDPEIFREFRKQVREALLAERLLGSDDALDIELSFSGSGDSGDWQEHHDDPHVQRLFDHLLQHEVSFDWYNNDGGGGSITWDVVADVITIDGYWNETIQNSVATVTISADGERDVQDPDEEGVE